MVQIEPIAVAVILAALGLAWKLGVRAVTWIVRELAENIVGAIGDTLSERWNADMAEALEDALKPINRELTDNGGNSLKDWVKKIDQRVGNVEQQLETSLMRNHFDDPDGTPI